MSERLPSPVVLIYFLALMLGSILLMGRLLWPFVSILILSYLLAAIFQPVYGLFKRSFSEQFASLATCVLVALVIFVPLLFFVGALSTEAYALFQLTKGVNLAARFTEILESNIIFVKVKGLLEGYGVSLEIRQFSKELADLGRLAAMFVYNQASAWAANLLHFIISSVMMLLVIFFLLIDRDRLITYLERLSPLPDDHDRRLLVKFEEISRAILIGNGICGLIQGLLGGMAFAIFGIGSPVLWGVLMAILAFLPIVGIGLILGPAALILLFQGQVGAGLSMAMFYVVLSFSVEYLLKPKIVGDQVEMPILLVFLSIMGGLAVFGVLGIIYGPLIVTGFLTLADIYIGNYDRLVQDPAYWTGNSSGIEKDKAGEDC